MRGELPPACPPSPREKTVPRDSRSPRGVIRSAVGVTSWAGTLPSVDAVRPAHCSTCGAASRPVGEGLGLHGHGPRDRQVFGPLEWGEGAQVREVRARVSPWRVVGPGRRGPAGPAGGAAAALHGAPDAKRPRQGPLETLDEGLGRQLPEATECLREGFSAATSTWPS